MTIYEQQLKSLLSKDYHPISNYSNFASFIFNEFEDISWAGFYFSNGKYLYLGPFQGQVACQTIDFDKGVCGHAFTTKKPVIVSNVHEFPGHIACDAGTNSELVIPLFNNNEIIGVLDLDSYKYNRFSKEDLILFTKLVDILIETV